MKTISHNRVFLMQLLRDLKKIMVEDEALKNVEKKYNFSVHHVMDPSKEPKITSLPLHLKEKSFFFLR